MNKPLYKKVIGTIVIIGAASLIAFTLSTIIMDSRKIQQLENESEAAYDMLDEALEEIEELTEQVEELQEK